MSRITILELFPLYYSARKWGKSSPKEIVRLEKEFTIVTTTKIKQEYKIDDQHHRKDEPASIWYYPNGNVYQKTWWMNGKRHRKNGPMSIWYYPYSNQVEEEHWYMNNKIHRKDGAARIKYYENGNKRYEAWYINGKSYPKDELLEIWYDRNGNIK